MNQLLSSLSLAQLKKAIAIREKIEALEKDLTSVLGVAPTPAPAAPAKKRTMSPAARAKISAAQTARWAKTKKPKAAAPAAKPKRQISLAGRRRLAALAKARWAKVRAAGKKSLGA